MILPKFQIQLGHIIAQDKSTFYKRSAGTEFPSELLFTKTRSNIIIV